MKLLLSKLTVAFSLLLCVAVATLYGRTSRGDCFYIRTGNGQFYFLNANPGWLDYCWSKPKQTIGKGWSIGHEDFGTQRIQLPIVTFWNRLGFWSGFTGTTTIFDGDYVRFQQVIIPIWSGCVICLILPAAWLFHELHRIKRARSGRCVVCNYDLRGSSARCPECGAVFTRVAEKRVD